MTVVPENKLRTFWEPQWAYAWKLYLEDGVDTHMLCDILRALPAERGEVSGDGKLTDPFVVLFTHDLDNEGARANETWILAILAERKLITFFGSEGASGPFAIDPYRQYSDKAVTMGIAEMFLKDFNVSPLEAVAVTSKDPIFLWGIEDMATYEQALQEYKTNHTNYWRTIERRAPMMFENLMAKMKEMSVSVGGVWVSDYNFGVGQRWLSERGIGHLGIRSSRAAKTQFGRNDKAIRGEPYDEKEAKLWELFGGSKRPKKGAKSFFKSLFRLNK
jgi:hypothetical protein